VPHKLKMWGCVKCIEDTTRDCSSSIEIFPLRTNAFSGVLCTTVCRRVLTFSGVLRTTVCRGVLTFAFGVEFLSLF